MARATTDRDFSSIDFCHIVKPVTHMVASASSCDKIEEKKAFERLRELSQVSLVVEWSKRPTPQNGEFVLRHARQ